MRARVEQILSELGQLRDLLLLMNRSPETASNDDADRTDAESVDTAPRESPEERRRRLLVLRSQQAAAQSDKSGGELKGVGNEIRQIVMELIHNRIDSKDRRERLEQKIQIPLEQLLASQWEPFRERISELESLAPRVDPSEWTQRLATAIEQNNAILAALTSILNDMVDIQDFNEVIDMVRGMLDEQDRVLERTKQEQKKRLLDALK
jgi:hypothetical protein